MPKKTKDRPMSKTKNILIPKLRFPEFIDCGEWEKKRLEEISEYRRGSFPQPYGLSGWYDDENGMPFIQVYDVDENLRLKPNTKRKITKVAGEQSVFIKKNTVIVTLQGSIGRVAITQYDAFIDRTLLLFQKFLKPIEKVFFAYTIQLLFEIEKQKAPGGIIKTITKEALSNFKILLPKPKEQQKIAYCLSSLDELIEAHSQKLELLKQHKKGLMQNLFPQEGEKVPKFRFSEFESDGAWEFRSIENNISLISGIALKSRELTDNKSGIPILRGINITEGKIRHSDEIDKFYLGDTIEIKKYLIEENDIVIGMDGSKVGKNVALISKEDEGAILIQRVAKIQAINSDIEFLYQHFLSNRFRNYVDKVNTSSGIPHISAKQIKSFEISFPPKVKEQQKIASCLSSLDDLITAQTEKIEQLKQHKKGLVQGLFPKIDN